MEELEGVLEFKFLDPEDMHELNCLHARIQLDEARKQVTDLTCAVIQLQAAAKVKELQEGKTKLDRDLNSRRARLEGRGRELSEKYGVDFSNVTYDDETGKITEL